jgi:hypothetical protein
LRALKNIYSLLATNSFPTDYLWKFFSKKKFKYFSLTFFWDMFKKYRDPNLPLLWRWGDNYTAQLEGSSLLQARNLIFKQLVLEDLGYNYVYTTLEVKTFKTAGIDPHDWRFFWKTWRLFIINMSDHDGLIAPPTQKIFFRKFSDIPTTEVPNNVIFNLTWWITAQFLYWKKAFITLSNQHKLLYWRAFEHVFSSWLFILTWTEPKPYVYFLESPFSNYVSRKFFDSDYVKYASFPAPDYYVGSGDHFFKKNYLFKNLSNSKLPRFLQLLKRSDPVSFLSKFWFYDPLENKNLLVAMKKNLMFYNELSSSPQHTISYFKPKRQPLVAPVNNYLALITPFAVVNYFSLAKENWAKTLIFKSSGVHPIPDFLKDFFTFLTFPEPTEEDFFYICVEPFLSILPDFQISLQRAEKQVDNFLGPLQVFKSYFNLEAQYKLSDPTLAYKALKKILSSMPGKDLPVWRFEPYGLNPFYKFSKQLTTNDVPFPEAVNEYTFFFFLKKKFKYSVKKQLLPNWVVKRKTMSITFSLTWKTLDFLSSYMFKSFSCKNFLSRLLFFKGFTVSISKKKYKPQNKLTKFLAKFDDNVNEIENPTPLEFLRLNRPNYEDLSSEQIEKIREELFSIIKSELFVKVLEKQKTHLIVEVMTQLTWIISITKERYAFDNLLFWSSRYDIYLFSFLSFNRFKPHLMIEFPIIYTENFMNFLHNHNLLLIFFAWIEKNFS